LIFYNLSYIPNILSAILKKKWGS